ncbi:MAG: peptide-binding protein [Jannaschia sp.]
MRALLVGLIWLATPALATQDAWPALYDVTGVAADDVLNIRATPDGGAEILGTLPPSSLSVEVIAPNDMETWGLVNVGERTGWVSLQFLVRQPGQWLGSFPQVTTCYGTEPFWSLDLTGNPSFSTPEGQTQATVLSRDTAPNRRDRHGLTMWLEGQGLLQAVIAQTECSDGMSDVQWGLEITAFRTGDMLSGCCSLSR